ncbi:MAG: glycosyl hydrolase 115 family protein, partial [Chitinophagaceae bacterium]|nr:glycosyl hydrolase 115 family protein [Chitinophagaceae bacterium]
NTNHIARIWEQMNMAWEYNAKQIWIVNVGDIKPMELPISFFLDHAWNPTKFTADNFSNYHTTWAAQQFGTTYAKEIGELLNKYTQYNARRKPELLDANTYNLYNEWPSIVDNYKKLLSKAEAIQKKLPATYHDPFFQLVVHPIKACANLNEMYYYVALNKEAYKSKFTKANDYAIKVKELYNNDSLITIQYHQINNGKWNHMMSQTHIGYTYWQQPIKNSLPKINYVSKDSIVDEPLYDTLMAKTSKTFIPKNSKGNVFYEVSNYVSVQAANFSKQVTSNNIKWQSIKDIGRDGNGIKAFPVTHAKQIVSSNSPHLEYEIYTHSSGEVKLHLYFSPTLNFHNTATGLQFAISIDNETPQTISLNKEDNNNRVWEQWAGNNIIVKTSNHILSKPGKHTIKYWLIDAGIVLQKIVLANGTLEKTYLGPKETRVNKQ